MNSTNSQVLIQFFDVKQLFSTYGKDGFLGDTKLELLVEMMFMF